MEVCERGSLNAITSLYIFHDDDNVVRQLIVGECSDLNHSLWECQCHFSNWWIYANWQDDANILQMLRKTNGFNCRTKKLMIYVAVFTGIIVKKVSGWSLKSIWDLSNFLYCSKYTWQCFCSRQCHHNIIITSLRLPHTSHLTESPKSSWPNPWNPHLLTHQIFIRVNLHGVPHQGGGAKAWFVVSLVGVVGSGWWCYLSKGYW